VERPRDRYGRPLKSGEDPVLAVPGVPVRDSISGPAAWTEALNYLDEDKPFHAHEVFEQRWRCCPPEERALWQALAQWGAALTHVARGNPVGAQRVASRALLGMEAADTWGDIDLDIVRTSLNVILRREG
jgi:hypothetical protein